MSLKTEALSQGLQENEYERIVELLGREPNRVELGIFAVMWSEHCSYKSTRIHLQNLPTKGSYVLQGPGENAGVIDLDGRYAVCFKVESHNHPSFIEPFQGAATGVGGILRDIFTMGARPIAVLDSLHFGDATHPRVPHLLKGVVSGISHYGNCMGIPTVNGEIKFDSCYNGNNLVNVMAVGVCRIDEIYTAKAEGIGNIVLYLGSKTGKDGIHGATMASEEFDDESADQRPTVQVGDPFMEKLVMEATLEMIQKKLIVAIQDMGAAGIACSTFEMSSKGECGMKINLDHVPLREENTSAYEIFLSESQERMLAVVHPEQLEEVLGVAKKWGVDCAAIGEIIAQEKVIAYHHGEKVVDLPVAPVSSNAPMYDRPLERREPSSQTFDLSSWENDSIEKIAITLLQSPSFAEKSEIYQQYDYSVGTDTLQGPGADASVMRIKGSEKRLGITLHSLASYCKSDPYKGMQHVVALCVRSLASVGAKAVATTNCLNFGNPEQAWIMSQIQQSIQSLGDACIEFECPITGGNVSLYNQTDQINIHPTPCIGMVGIVEAGTIVPSAFIEDEEDEIFWVGDASHKFSQMYQSLVVREMYQIDDLACPPLSIDKEKDLQTFLLNATEKHLIRSTRPIAQGGLFKALVSLCSTFGCEVSIPDGVPSKPFLFGEYSSGVLLSTSKAMSESLTTFMDQSNLDYFYLGKSGGKKLSILGELSIDLTKLDQYRNNLWETL
ncbi:MAG: phosphoribosylformylglycinamidine synthase subunit PurL [Bdellovibrionales bacterium]|nr:phosphoribosylformylglycinamidine synthase subunit PurL [Bdellovibrionales bacterium]